MELADSTMHNTRLGRVTLSRFQVGKEIVMHIACEEIAETKEKRANCDGLKVL